MKLLIGILLMLAAIARGQTYEAKLSWQPSPDTNVVGYKIYYAFNCSTNASQATCTNVVVLGNVTSAIITGLAPSTTYSFAATDFDAEGDESVFSNTVIYTTPVLLQLGLWPALQVPALVSTDLLNWVPTNFSVLLTNAGAGWEYFRIVGPSMILTNKQPE